MVELNCETDFVANTPDFQELVRDIAMHIAAAKPRFANREEVTQEILDKEKSLISEELKNTGKPDEIINHNGVVIDGTSNIASEMSIDASGVLSKNIVSFLTHVFKEGEMDLEFAAGIRNTSDDYIARAQVTVKAMDQRDAQVDDNVDYYELPAKTGRVFTPSFWGLKYGKLKNGSFNVSASVYLPIAQYAAEDTPKLSDD